MIFVPVPPPAPVSHRTRELADLLGRVVEEYEKHHPSVTGAEVRQAIHLAARSSRAPGREVARLLVAAVTGVLALLGVLVWMMADRGAIGGGALPMVGVAVVLSAIIAVLVIVRRVSGG